MKTIKGDYNFDWLVKGYLQAVLDWSTDDDGNFLSDEPANESQRLYTVDDICPHCKFIIEEECGNFYTENYLLLEDYFEQMPAITPNCFEPMEWAGSDFYLSRNGSEGFASRGLGELGQELDQAAKNRDKYPQFEVQLGDDGKVYVYNTDHAENKEQEPLTKVIFRKYRDGDIIALFVEQLGTISAYTCASYIHVGQHGSADPVMLIQRTKPAKEAEYQELKRELERIGYKLKVIKRHTQKHLQARKEALAAMA